MFSLRTRSGTLLGLVLSAVAMVSGVGSASATTIVSQVTLGQSYGILNTSAFAIDSKNLYAANSSARVISVIDRVTQQSSTWEIPPNTSYSYGTANYWGQAQDIVRVGTVLYTANYNGTVGVFDTTSPTGSPSYFVVAGGIHLSSIAYANGSLYLLDPYHDTFYICDPATPTGQQSNCTVMSSATTYGANVIEIVGSTMYLGTGNGTILVWDISSTPTLTHTISVPGLWSNIADIAIDGTTLYAIENGNGFIYSIDLTNYTVGPPHALIGGVHLTIGGDYLYVTQSSGAARQVVQVERATFATTDSWPAASGYYPNGITYAGGTVYTGFGTSTTTTQYLNVLSGLPLPAHAVTFDSNGGAGSIPVQSSSTATTLSQNTYSRAGYTFTGWNTLANGSGTGYSDQASYPFTTDVVLYAQWVALPGSGSASGSVAAAAQPSLASTGASLFPLGIAVGLILLGAAVARLRRRSA